MKIKQLTLPELKICCQNAHAGLVQSYFMKVPTISIKMFRIDGLVSQEQKEEYCCVALQISMKTATA